jgi:hypothetical protein
MDEKNANLHQRAKFRLWILLLLVAAAVTVLWAAQREPAYQGKTAGYWLNKMASPMEQEAAVSAFRAMGKPGVLFLVNETRSKPPSHLRVSNLRQSRRHVGV